MAETQGSSRRRRRGRRRPSPGPAETVAPAEPAPEVAAVAPATGAPAKREPAAPSRRRPRDPEGGLRELVGGGSSQLGVNGALRGRDVNRPTDDDIEAAERDIVVVRRHWTPPPS